MKSILYLLSITLLASGCIREDLSLCPDETSAVSLTLSCPEEVCGNDADRNIRRTDFYIFDPDGRFVCSKTDASGPFGSDYACRILF